MEDNEIKITQHLLLEEVNLATGDIQFNGSLEIKGDVGVGAVIRATGDIVIDGTVEGATIECGGSIVLKKGMNAAGHGQITAGKDVVSRFFENVKVVAKGNIEVDKLAHVHVRTRHLSYLIHILLEFLDDKSACLKGVNVSIHRTIRHPKLACKLFNRIVRVARHHLHES